MTIVEERELTRVEPPLVEPIPEELEGPAPPRLEPEKKARPRVVRWLAWVAGVVFIGLAVTAISWMIDENETVEGASIQSLIVEEWTDRTYSGPAQLPGGVIPADLVPTYGVSMEAPAYTASAQLPGGVLPDNLVTESVETPLTGYP